MNRNQVLSIIVLAAFVFVIAGCEQPTNSIDVAKRPAPDGIAKDASGKK